MNEVDEGQPFKTTSVTIKHRDEVDREADKAVRRLINADAAYSALADMRDKLFRPARKHGYEDVKITEPFEAANEVEVPDADYEGGKAGAGHALVDALEQKFIDILQEHGLDLEDT